MNDQFFFLEYKLVTELPLFVQYNPKSDFRFLLNRFWLFSCSLLYIGFNRIFKAIKKGGHG